MFKNNCLQEVRKFNALKLKSPFSHKLIGVQEINSYLKGQISLNQCKDLNIKTRQYAKTNTWARGHMKNWKSFIQRFYSFKKVLKVVS